MDELNSLVAASSAIDYRVSWHNLRVRADHPPFRPGALLTKAPQPYEDQFLPKPATWLERIVPAFKSHHERAAAEGARRLEEARAKYQRDEQLRLTNLAQYRAAHDSRVKLAEEAAAAKNSALDQLRAGYLAGNADAVQSVLEIILAKDQLPDIDSAYAVAYEKPSRRAVLERQLPTMDIVPEIESVRYVKSANEFTEKRRPLNTIKTTYSTLCASIVVRTMRAIATGDEAHLIETIVVNGYVDTIDPATGRRIRPTLISASATADDIRSLEVAVLDPVACLKRLKARVSPSAHELIPVTPIMDFNMLDARFVAETDVLGILDTRPNLADLTPSEFESLMTNLFEKMGLETRQTRASRDGGVDCVAWDTRPVIGGKVVIQAKRYKNTVGVSAVRDLYGTMMNEHAAKGILVTTSGYGRASYGIRKGKTARTD